MCPRPGPCPRAATSGKRVPSGRVQLVEIHLKFDSAIRAISVSRGELELVVAEGGVVELGGVQRLDHLARRCSTC